MVILNGVEIGEETSFLLIIINSQGHRLPIAQVFFKKLGYNVVMLSYRG